MNDLIYASFLKDLDSAKDFVIEGPTCSNVASRGSRGRIPIDAIGEGLMRIAILLKPCEDRNRIRSRVAFWGEKESQQRSPRRLINNMQIYQKMRTDKAEPIVHGGQGKLLCVPS